MKQFTEEDLRKAFEAAQEQHPENKQRAKFTSFEDYLSSLPPDTGQRGGETKEEVKSLFNYLSEHGGEIVSSNSLPPEQINQARASNRMFVDDNNLGYVWMPPFHKIPETVEEVKQFEKWFPLEIEVPDDIKDVSFLRTRKRKQEQKEWTEVQEAYSDDEIDSYIKTVKGLAKSGVLTTKVNDDLLHVVNILLHSKQTQHS